LYTQGKAPKQSVQVCRLPSEWICMYVCMDGWMGVCMYVCMHACMPILMMNHSLLGCYLVRLLCSPTSPNLDLHNKTHVALANP
jgi:hypothetical protein